MEATGKQEVEQEPKYGPVNHEGQDLPEGYTEECSGCRRQALERKRQAAEIVKLTKRLEDLGRVNLWQVERLRDRELLKIRIRELEAQLRHARGTV